MIKPRFLFEQANDPANTDPNGGGAGDNQQQQQQAPAIRHGWLKDDLSFEDGWQNQLPDDRFGDVKATLANYRDLPALAKALKESKSAAMQRLDGMLKKPADDAPAEEWQAFYRQIGAPEKPEEYAITKPEGELAKYFNDERANDFRKTAHELGLTKRQAEALVQWQMKGIELEDSKLAMEGREALKVREETLRNTWGSDFDKRMADVQRVAMTFGVNAEDLQFLPPEWTLGFAKIAAAMSEDKLVSREQFHNKLNPLDRAKDLMRTPEYMDPANPKHKDTVAMVNQLYQQAEAAGLLK